MVENFEKIIKKAIELHKLGNFEDAKHNYLEALRLEPENHNVYKMLSSLEYQNKDIDKSLEYINKAIEIKNDISELYSIKGFYLHSQKKKDQAIENFNKALKIDSNNIDALLNLGVIFKENNEKQKSINYFNKVTSIDKSNFKAFTNKAYLKIEDRNYEDALIDLNYAISINKRYFNAYLMRGNVYKELKHFDKSLMDYNFLINSRIECGEQLYNEAKFNKGLLELLLGNFKEGWDNYEFRFKVKKNFVPNILKEVSLLKSINDCKNKNVLILPEQGIGDQIVYLSLINEFKNYCKKLTVMTDKRLLNLLNNSMKDINFIDQKKNFQSENIDYYIHLGSICKFLRNDLQSFEKKRRFIFPNEKISKNINKVMSKNKFKIGISWTSFNSDYEFDKTITLNKLFEAFHGLNVDLINLQYGNVKEEIKNFDVNNNKSVINFENIDNKNDIEGLYSIIDNCDLIISTSNATIQFSGSIGKETWVLLPYLSHFHWLNDRKKSIWYENVYLFRQSKRGDWSNVLSEINKKLKLRISQ